MRRASSSASTTTRLTPSIAVIVARLSRPGSEASSSRRPAGATQGPLRRSARVHAFRARWVRAPGRRSVLSFGRASNPGLLGGSVLAVHRPVDQPRVTVGDGQLVTLDLVG